MRDMKKKARGYSEYPEESVVDREMSRQGEVWKLKGQQEERGSRGLNKGLKRQRRAMRRPLSGSSTSLLPLTSSSVRNCEKRVAGEVFL